MRAMVFEGPGRPLAAREIAAPTPGDDQLLIRVSACAVCRTDLHIIDGELPHPKSALVPGHEIVGVVVDKGSRVDRFAIGDRVGVPWLGWTCGGQPWICQQRTRPTSSANCGKSGCVRTFRADSVGIQRFISAPER